MSENSSPGCIVVTEFAVSDSSVFSGYIDYIDRENAVRNDHISDFSLYTDYMDNPEKTSALFTSCSDHLTAEEKQNYKRLYKKAQDNGSPMWQTVISFDNRWLEEHGLYDSESGFVCTKTLMNYTRNAVSDMLKAEGLENGIWTAAFHYNTDNLHVHIATVEPTPTRQKVQVKTIRFPADWIKENEIVRSETITPDKTVAAHKERNYGYRNIHDRITDILSKQGYNTRLLGDYITIHSNGSIDLSFRGDNSSVPDMAKLIDSHLEYKGKFKQSSIDKCRSKMVNQIIDYALDNQKLNEVMRNNIAVSMKGNILFEDRDIIRQFLYVYNHLPKQRNDWNYKTNKIAHLRPELDKITDMYLNKYKSEEFTQFKSLVENQGQIYKKAYGGDADKKRIRGKTKELYKNCGNIILNQMREMSLRDIHELESNSYIAAEVDEAACTGEHLDFDGNISYKTNENDNKNKYWNSTFKQARNDLKDVLTLTSEYDAEFKASELNRILSVFINESEKGNAIASYELGRNYQMGTFGKIDPELSYEYYHKAFEGFNNELESDAWLENMIAASKYGEEHPNATPDEIRKASEKFSDKRQSIEWLENYLYYKIGRMHLNGEGTEKDINKAVSYLEQSNSPYAAFTLGNIYYKGADDIIEQDYNKAYTYFTDAGFTEAGEKPVPFALCNMAEMLEKGFVKDARLTSDYLYKEALKLFVASENENPNDLIEYRLASMYLNGKGCDVNEEIAEKYLFDSAVYGNTYAQTKLALLYIKSGEPIKAGRAVFLLDLAANSGNDIAQYQLGKIKIDSKSEYFNAAEGIELLEKSANQDNDFALYTLGSIYLNGSITEKDIPSALRYLNAASDKGNQFAQYTLGVIYLKGEICNSNINKAIELFEQSADQNNPFAQYQLGKIYYFGADGINPDIEKAMDYLTKSAEQGNEYAIALINWKPSIYTSFSHGDPTFSETMVSLSSDMRQLFERLSNEHDHMLNQMIYQRTEREKAKEENQIQ